MHAMAYNDLHSPEEIQIIIHRIFRIICDSFGSSCIIPPQAGEFEICLLTTCLQFITNWTNYDKLTTMHLIIKTLDSGDEAARMAHMMIP